MLVLLYRRKHLLCIHRDELHYLRLDLSIVKVLVVRGLPMGLQMLIVSSSMLTVLGLINGYGTDDDGSYSINGSDYNLIPAFALPFTLSATAPTP